MSKLKKTVTEPTEGKQMSEQKKLLVKAPEAAAMLSLGKSKLWSMTVGRQIPCVRIGKAVRYSVADLEAWIEQQKVPALAC